MLAALDARGLKMFSTYVGVNVGPDGPEVAPALSSAINHSPAAPPRSGSTSRASVTTAPTHDASTAGPGTAGCHQAPRRPACRSSSTPTSASMSNGSTGCSAGPAGRPPERRRRLQPLPLPQLQDANELDATLDLARPYLRLVSINGADPDPAAGWDRLIQPLDSGHLRPGPPFSPSSKQRLRPPHRPPVLRPQGALNATPRPLHRRLEADPIPEAPPDRASSRPTLVSAVPCCEDCDLEVWNYSEPSHPKGPSPHASASVFTCCPRSSCLGCSSPPSGPMM